MNVYDLRSVRVVVIVSQSSPKYDARKRRMESLLTGFQATFHTSGNDYPYCLARANIQIMKDHLDRPTQPLLILEDDVGWNGQTTIHCPADADLMYLGLSALGVDRYANKHDDAWCTGLDSRISPTADAGVVRVRNSLTTHAVLYLNPDVLRILIPLFQYMVNNPEPLIVLDVALARLQPLFKTYGCNPPVFWQSTEADDSDHQKQAEALTRIHL
jgi:hypothetical protein